MDLNKLIDRKDFFSSLGLSAAAFTALTCFGCSKNGGNAVPSPPATIDFTLDLTASNNAALQTNGGYLVSQGIIVARTTTGNFIAVQESCTHQNYPLQYQGAQQVFYCNNHGATFKENGAIISGPTNTSLATYHTSLSGNALRVYS